MNHYEKSFEMTAYIAMTIGVIGDHVSTRIALSKPYNYESNSLVANLMGLNRWLAFDILFLVPSIICPYFLMRNWNFKGRWAILVFPLITGVFRMMVTLWNLSLCL